MRNTSRFVFFPFIFIALLLAFGCSSSSDSSSTGGTSGAGGAGGTRAPSAQATYRELGPFAVGVTTLDLPDRQVEVWYPADPSSVEGLEPYSYFIRDYLSELALRLLQSDVNPPFVTDAYLEVPATDQGPFPLVIFAHGALSYRNQSAFLTAHLASWGFVVASVDYLERGIGQILGEDPESPIGEVEATRAVVDLIDVETERAGGLLEGVASTEQIGITGHSAGGGTSYQFGLEPDVVTYIPLSGGISSENAADLPDKPSLWLTGKTDGIVELERTVSSYEAAKAPKRLVLIDDMGHLGPSDICTIGGGGVIPLALEAGLPLEESTIRLGTDGCAEDDVIEDGWPIIRHFVTSQLRWAFGIDEEPVGLSQDIETEFPEATFDYEEEL